MPLEHPAEFPSEAIRLVIDKLRGRDVPLSDLAHAVLDVLHYAVDQTLGHPSPAFGAGVGAGEPLPPEDLPAVLESALEAHDQDNPRVRAALPWGPIALALLRLLADLLAG